MFLLNDISFIRKIQKIVFGPRDYRRCSDSRRSFPKRSPSCHRSSAPIASNHTSTSSPLPPPVFITFLSHFNSPSLPPSISHSLPFLLHLFPFFPFPGNVLGLLKKKKNKKKIFPWFFCLISTTGRQPQTAQRCGCGGGGAR